MTYTRHYSRKKTPQTQPIPGKDMVKMRSGGYGFKVGDWEQLRRFLILGTLGGTYYASEQEMTVECAQLIERCLAEDYQATVDMVVEVSDQGLALKNDHALFALALAASHDDAVTRVYALSKLSQVARIASHLFMFLSMAKEYRGFGGRAFKRAVSNWYTQKPLNKLAYQLVKYRNRYGWTHRDVLRMIRPTAFNDEQNALFNWVTQGVKPASPPDVLKGHLIINQESNWPIPALAAIEELRLPRESIPTHKLKDPDVWSAMLPNMPLTAMVRNLGVMTANDTLKPFVFNTQMVVDKLTDEDIIKRSRIHPIQLLFALKTYAQGHGMRGKQTWQPIAAIIDALEEAYYMAFDNVEQTNLNIVAGVDISGSMSGYWGNEGAVMAPYEFAAAMAMVSARSSNNFEMKGFDHQLHHLPITAKTRLDDALRIVGESGGGRTSAQLPIQWAANEGIPVDAFILYSDGESWSGDQHVSQALETYRRVMNSPHTKLICVNFTATAYSMADSDDSLSLNVVGNSPDVARVISVFLEG